MQEIPKKFPKSVKNALEVAELKNYPEEKLIEIINKIEDEKIQERERLTLEKIS